MAGVFINYRRGDAKSEAGRLFDWLSRYFGKDQVFMDVSGSIEPGLEFDTVIEKAVSSCDALIVVIGKEWLTATNEKGKRRLDDPNDFVRMEVAAALRRDIRVIPVLVQGAGMPDEGSLPDDLKRLSKRQASEISDNRWEFDTEQLVKVLEKAGVKAKPGQKVPSQTVVSDERAAPPPQVTKKFSWKAIASLVLGMLMMSLFSEETVDQDTKIGGLIFSLVALGLGIIAFYDVKHSPDVSRTGMKMLSIAGIALGAILTLAFIGTLTASDTPVPPVVDTQPSSSLPAPAPSVTTPSVSPPSVYTPPLQTPTVPKPSVPKPSVSTPSLPRPSVPAPPAASVINISGSWRGQDGTYVFQQSGNRVNFQLYGWDQLLIAQGNGAIVQGMVTITYARVDNTGGEARLQVSVDGRQMVGSYRNRVTGEAGLVVLAR